MTDYNLRDDAATKAVFSATWYDDSLQSVLVSVTVGDADACSGLAVAEKNGLVTATKVQQGSQAEKYGFRLRDIIRCVNGTEVSTVKGMQAEISGLSHYVVVVSRRRQIPLQEPPLPPGYQKSANCGYFLVRLKKCDDHRISWDVKDSSVSVKSIGVEKECGLQVGDKILSIGRDTIESIDGLLTVITAAKGGPVDFLVERLLLMNSAETFDQLMRVEKGPTLGDPCNGVPPIPVDVQKLADTVRKEIVDMIK